jgi:dipeptidase E
MKKIIAIGGGEIGRPGYPIETTKIDKEIIRLTGKKNPKLLFIGTASDDSDLYIKAVKKHFGKRLECRVSCLLLTKNKYSKKDLEKIILSSDIIYVGGGNTMKMLLLWKNLGVDKIFEKAEEKGIVLSGVSAGANCWFKYSNSDSRKKENPKKNYILLRCLGFINAVMCPHYDVEKGRRVSLKKHMKTQNLVAIALGNCSALEIVNNKYRLITSKKNAIGYKVFWSRGKFNEISIPKKQEFLPLSDLLNVKDGL